MPHLKSFSTEAWADLLDPSPLAALVDLDPHGGLAMRVLRVFAQSLPGYVDLMEQARLVGDTVSAKRAAHSVKSSAATVGAQVLSRVSFTAEQRCTEGSAWADSQEISAFLSECLQLHGALSHRLAALTPAADTI